MTKYPGLILIALFACITGDCQQFSVSYSAAAFNGPFSGKVILYLNKENKHPKDAPADLESFPCLAMEVKGVKPGAAIVLDDRAIAYPVKLSEIERGEYFVQAVWDRNLGGRAIAASPGNLYSLPIRVNLTKEFLPGWQLRRRTFRLCQQR